MVKSARFWGLWVCGFASPAPAETIESLEKKLEGVTPRVTSMRCKQATRMQTEMGGGNSMSQEAAQEFECMKVGDKVLWRLESRGVRVDKTPQKENKSEFHSIAFDDGTQTWKLLGDGDQQVAWKMKTRDAEDVFADKAFFDHLQQGSPPRVLTVKPDEPVDGKACYVVEALPEMFKGRLGPGEGVTYHYIQQDTGIVVKMVTNDTKAKPMTTLTRTDIEINPPISPDRFKPPPGVPVKE